ncbi:MAG: hypothetical protein Q4E62_02930, partial [Sutterellaceae bacterium]|nr:hypothetical protein [Sutterellaceae bacterium]
LERFSLDEVDAPVANAVIEAMRNTTIKGKNVTVRRDRPKKNFEDSETKGYESRGRRERKFEGRDKPRKDARKDKRSTSRFYDAEE